MTVILAAIAALTVTCAAGLGWLAHLLGRDRGKFWRPGMPLPEVDQDAPIRRRRSAATH